MMETCKGRQAAERFKLWVYCSKEMRSRLKAIAKRDAVTFSMAVRQLIEYALPHFEPAKKPKK